MAIKIVTLTIALRLTLNVMQTIFLVFDIFLNAIETFYVQRKGTLHNLAASINSLNKLKTEIRVMILLSLLICFDCSGPMATRSK